VVDERIDADVELGVGKDTETLALFTEVDSDARTPTFTYPLSLRRQNRPNAAVRSIN
jgi:hypothetical protein